MTAAHALTRSSIRKKGLEGKYEILHIKTYTDTQPFIFFFETTLSPSVAQIRPEAFATQTHTNDYLYSMSGSYCDG